MRQFLSSHVVPLKRVSYILPCDTLTPASSDARYGIRSVCMMSDEKDQVSGYVSKSPTAPTKHDITRSVLINPCANWTGCASLRDIARFTVRSYNSFSLETSRVATAREKKVATFQGGYLHRLPPLACESACLPTQQSRKPPVSQTGSLFAVRHAAHVIATLQIPQGCPTKRYEDALRSVAQHL